MSAFKLDIAEGLDSIRRQEARNLDRALYAWREQAFIIGPFAARVSGGTEYDELLERHADIVREHREGGKL